MLEIVKKNQPTEPHSAEREFHEILAETDKYLKLQTESMRKASARLLEASHEDRTIWGR